MMEGLDSMTRGEGRWGRWSVEEHRMFLEGLERHGTDWNAISDLVKTRTPAQTRVHHQKIEQQRSKGKNYPEQVRLDTFNLYQVLRGRGGGGGRSFGPCCCCFIHESLFLVCSEGGPQQE